MHSIDDTCEGTIHLVPEQLHRNSVEGKLLVNAISTQLLSGEELYQAVRTFLESHAQVIGTQNIAAARLKLYNELHELTPYELAERLERLVVDSLNIGERFIAVDRELRAKLGSFIS